MWNISQAVKIRLEERFQKSNKIGGIELTRIARKLGLTDTQVRNWFSRRNRNIHSKSEYRSVINSPDDKKMKINLCNISNAIKIELERKFEESNSIKGIELIQFAEKIGLTVRQVSNWFSRRKRSNHSDHQPSHFDQERSFESQVFPVLSARLLEPTNIAISSETTTKHNNRENINIENSAVSLCHSYT